MYNKKHFENKIFVNFIYPSKNKLKIYKKNNYIYARAKISPRLIKTSNNMIKLQFEKYIDNFIKIVSNHRNNLNIENLIKTFEDTYFQIKNKNLSELKNGSRAGSYSFEDNKYTIDYFLPICVYHELFHLATSSYIGLEEHCGFRKYNLKFNYSIGRGINEGYTELLTERYFNDSSRFAYINEVDIALLLELIIGSKKMRKLYFDSDLDGLISELTKYDKRENIICFLQEIDIINLISFSKDISTSNVIKLQKAFTFVYNFLFNCIKIKTNTLKNIKFADLLEVINFMLEERTVLNIPNGENINFTCLDKEKYYDYISSIKDKNGKHILMDQDINKTSK